MCKISILLFICHLLNVCKADLSCQSAFISKESLKYSMTSNSSLSNRYSIVTSTDPRYDDLRRHANNLRHKSNAAYIVYPKKSEYVIQILRHALVNNLRPTIRSGGHCYEDFWSNNTGILIDMSMMNRIYRSPNDETIWVESGAKIEQFYNILYKDYGLTCPASACLDNGVGGNILAGGYGYLVRKFGLSIDYVHAFEIATVNANRTVDLVVVHQSSNIERDRNLYWALRGAGSQNFGVVTKIGFRNLPESPKLVYQYKAAWTLNVDLSKEMLIDLLWKFSKFVAENSGVDSEYCDMFIGAYLNRKHDKATLSISFIITGGNKTKLVDTLMSALGLNESQFICNEMSYFRLQVPRGSRNSKTDDTRYYVRRSAYMLGPFPRHQLEVMWSYFTDPIYSNVSDGQLQFGGYGCAVSKIPETDTAYPHRRAVMKLQYGNVWADGDDVDFQWRWSRDLYRDMYGNQGPQPDGLMDGCFLNYPDSELVNWQRLYFKNNYERLTLVKQQWDPLNIFHHKQSIELPDERTN